MTYERFRGYVIFATLINMEFRVVQKLF